MNDNTLFLISIFCSEFADIQSKSIKQHFSQNIFFAAPEKAADSPILLQYAKLTFGLNGTIQPKLPTQICCDSSLRLCTVLPKGFGKLNRPARFRFCTLRFQGTFTARLTAIHTLFGYETEFAFG